MFADGTLPVYQSANGDLIAKGSIQFYDQMETREATYIFYLTSLKSKNTKIHSKGVSNGHCANSIDTLNAVYSELSDQKRYRVPAYSEIGSTNHVEDKVTVFFRQAVDVALNAALQMAHFQKAKNIKSSFHINNASSLYDVMDKMGNFKINPAALPAIREIQSLGHEIGYHNDT